MYQILDLDDNSTDEQRQRKPHSYRILQGLKRESREERYKSEENG
ncbi:uncharacterized protein G2W53_033846 [Senna tora]|uniref:Uncharacterized protein n=1 Tax=Senna tora TaxID=362788 RepID=A0A834W7C0_9FABA|nr:uncharacterized protein G2W53_033846 [Senna tora]